MPDIRRTDYFDLAGPAEYPMRLGGRWGPVDTYWGENEKEPGLQFGSGALAYPHDTGNGLFWSVNNEASYTGDVEAWGTMIGGQFGVAGEGWRIGLWDALSLGGGGTARGYVAMLFIALGGLLAIRKYTAADTWSYLAAGAPDSPWNQQMLLRRRGDDIELWQGLAGGSVWTLKLSATDTDYVTNMMVGFGSEDPTHGGLGWESVGGGQRTRTRIIRYVSN